MARAARILVVGQSLPFRGELLEHREIEIRWATDTREVASQLRRSKVDARIARIRLEHALGRDAQVAGQP